MQLRNLVAHKRILAENCGEITEKVVFINRVAKVVKGGRRFSFSALVVAGDGRGHVGFGLGKAGEVPDAIRKGGEKARKNMLTITLSGTTIPHDVLGVFGPTTVVMRPAAPGTGVIAGSAVRSVIEAVGIRDILSKCIGSNNPNNVLQATINGLLMLKDPQQISDMRKIKLDEMGFAPHAGAQRARAQA